VDQNIVIAGQINHNHFGAPLDFNDFLARQKTP